jgi:methylenetetrahydrofolate dehydrogenase (NADP+) / methenyltetrahydrofolate cyclohydrolase
MPAQILDGKALAATIRGRLKTSISAHVRGGRRAPGLAVILVGNNPASEVYVRNKIKACEDVGIVSKALYLPEQTTEADVLALIASLNEDPDIDGILVQLPLPKHINEKIVTETIVAHKDVDGFLPENIGKLALREPLLRPCTPYGVIVMLEQTGINLAGLDAVVVGQSNIVGRPMALELLLKGCTVTICHSKTQHLAEKISQADVVVAAIGKPQFVPGAWVKPGAIVIDVGINRLPSGQLVGDVDFDTASEKAAWITPVPGGVGPMTIAMLLQNTLIAYEQAS